MIWLYFLHAAILIAGIQAVGSKHGNWKERIETLKSKRAMAIKNAYGSARWPGGVIHFAINPNDFTPEEKTTILTAMQDYMKYTCVKFVNQYATNMIKIQNGKGCHSNIGMKGGVQALYLAKGCRNKMTILHELGHAIGLIHEHQRPDRDQFITINLQNAKGESAYNFKKYAWSAVQNLGVPYDYKGIMEYASSDFSSNGYKVLVPKDRTKILGQSSLNGHLTFYDIKAVNMMYKCDKGCDIYTYQCPDNFVGKDCQCWCKPTLIGGTYDTCEADLFG